MRILSLVDNVSSSLPTEHGLSLYVEMDNDTSFLFDMGQSDLFMRNARSLWVDLSSVGFAVLSHGHYDHGGGLSTFLECNTHAPVFVNQHIFENHYSLREDGMTYIGLDRTFENHSQLVYCDDIYSIDDKKGKEKILFSGGVGSTLCPRGNRLLFGPTIDVNDSFKHEQSLLVHDNGKWVLFAGCAHSGIVNIIRRSIKLVGEAPDYVFAGFHLVKSGLDEEAEQLMMEELSGVLKSFPQTVYYTMHCTGTVSFERLREMMGDRLRYLSCGDMVEV